MADRADVLTSAAYLALKPAGRQALHLIEGEIERCGGRAAISLEELQHRLKCSRVTTRIALKQLALCSFISVGVGVHQINVFALTDGWRALDAVEAQRLVKQARKPMPLRPAMPKRMKPAPKPKPPKPPKVEPQRIERQTAVSLAKLTFMDDGR